MTPTAIDAKRPATQAGTAPPKTEPKTNPEALIREAFDDVALVIGGIAVLHNLDDDLIWTLMKRLDRIRVRLLRDLNGAAPAQEFEPAQMPALRTHAAVDEFLFRNRVRMGE